MEREVYVSAIRQENVGKLAKIVVDVFDKFGQTAVFSSSSMSKYNAEKYMATMLKLSGKDSWFKVFFGLSPFEFCATMDEEQNEIVALSNDQATLFKNEIVLNKSLKNSNNAAMDEQM